MRIESSNSSQRELVGSNTHPVSSQRIDNAPKDTIDNKKIEKGLGEAISAFIVLFAAGCALLFGIFDCIREWIKMRNGGKFPIYCILFLPIYLLSWEDDPRIEQHLKESSCLLKKASRDPRAKEVASEEEAIYSQKCEDGIYVREKDLPNIR